MSRVLVTFALDAYTELQEVALAGLQEYADLHGYDLHTDPPGVRSRPASWLKIPLLLELLDLYEEALWVDADVVIADATGDVVVAGDAWQALVRHHTADGEVPNCGVWLVRRPMRRVLLDLWAMTRYVEHPWWEQAALHELLGYRGRPVRLASPTPLYEMTEWLDAGWNVHPRDLQTCEWPRFLHATTLPDRAKVMRRWARTAVAA